MPPTHSLLRPASSASLWPAALALWLTLTPAQAEEPHWAFDVAHAHIAKEYAWPRSDYHLRIRYEEDGIVALHIHHKDDERRKSGDVMWAGGGKSFELYLDAATHTVVKELGFQ